MEEKTEKLYAYEEVVVSSNTLQNIENSTLSVENMDVISAEVSTDFSSTIPAFEKKNTLLNLQAKKDENPVCDNIIFRNGEEVTAVVLEVSETVIKYKKCDHLDGPIYSVSKNKVLMVKYKNGTKEVFTETKEKEAPKPLYPLSIMSLVLAIIGILIGWFFSIIIGVSLGTIAIVFGIISLVNISKNKSYSGSTIAILGLIFGLIGVVGLLTLVALSIL